MRAYGNITIYTADDEDTLCGRCDNVCDGNDELCVERCGADILVPYVGDNVIFNFCQNCGEKMREMGI